MTEKLTRIDPTIPTYNDGRTRIQDLYKSYDLFPKTDWIIEAVTIQDGLANKNHRIHLPILSIRTKAEGPAFWSLFGVHGEEPAGPMALVENIEAVIELGKIVPMVIFPLVNPLGYVKDWRYENERRDMDKGKSIGDSEHLLPDLHHPKPKARKPEPVSPSAQAFTQKVLELTTSHPGLISVDHHEDEDYSRKRKHRSVYIYTHGRSGTKDPAAIKAVEILRHSGIPFILNGETRSREKIDKGIVMSHDGSIDELLASDEIILNDQKQPGPGFHTVIVIETSTRKTALSKRIVAHQNIINAYPTLLSLRLAQEVKSLPIQLLKSSSLLETNSPLSKESS